MIWIWLKINEEDEEVGNDEDDGEDEVEEVGDKNLLKSSEVLASFWELSFLHSLTNIPANNCFDLHCIDIFEQ